MSEEDDKVRFGYKDGDNGAFIEHDAEKIFFSCNGKRQEVQPEDIRLMAQEDETVQSVIDAVKILEDAFNEMFSFDWKLTANSYYVVEDDDDV